MRGILLTLLIAIAEAGVAQNPPSASPAPPPAAANGLVGQPPGPIPSSPAPASPVLSASTQIAINAIRTQQQQLQAEFAGVDGDVRNQFPGWHLDGGTLTVVRDQATSAVPTQNVPRKELKSK